MFERRHVPFRKKTLPLTCCFMGDFDFQEKKLMEENQKKQLEEAAQSRSTNIVIYPPSPIR